MGNVVLRLAATLALGAYAGVALFSGLDRLAGDVPSVPAPQNWPYARNASYNAAQQAADRRQWGTAESLMARTLLTDPVNERVIGGLGRIRLSAGDPAGAEAAFKVSAQRGWRDPATHVYWMTKSIELGDLGAAAIQADALLRGPVENSGRDRIIDPLLEYDEGRDALAARLRQSPPWANVFAYGLDRESIDELAGRADVIGRAGRGIWSCLGTSGLIDRLLGGGQVDAAQRTHDASCSQSHGPDSLINDGHFIRYIADGKASALDWVTPESGDIAITPDKDQAGHPFLRLRVTMPATTLVLAQRVIAKPGTYRVSWRMPDTDPHNAHALSVTLDCDADLAKSVTGAPLSGRIATYTADIRLAGDCPTAVIGVWAAPSTNVTIADVALSRLKE